MAQPPQNSFKWIDLSPYGMKLMAVGLPNRSLVLVIDGAEKHADKVRDLGFVFHEPSGFHVHVGNPAPSFADMARAFPEARLIQTGDTMADGTPVTKELFYHRSAAHPRPREAAPAVRQPPIPQERPRQPAADAVPPIEVLLAQSTYLGRNKLGHRVYRNVRGRFMEASRGEAVFESDRTGLQPGLFLRATDETQLAIAADGFIGEMSGTRMRFDDLIRFASAVYDTEMASEDPRLGSAHAAIEGALARWLAANGGKTMAEVFRSAQRLHEAHPYIGDLSRHQEVPGGMMPQPVSVAAQRILGTDADIDGKNVIVTGSGSLFSHLGRGAKLKVFEPDPARAVHARQAITAGRRPAEALIEAQPDYSGADMVIASLDRGLLDSPRDYDGMSVSRSDMAEILDSLQARAADGRSVFILRGGASQEERDEMERVRKYIGMRYYVEGTVDIDGGLHCGRADAPPMRIYAVGPRRHAVLTGAEWDRQAGSRPSGKGHHAALDLTIANDWNQVWSWTTQTSGHARKQIADFAATLDITDIGDEGADAEAAREENSFQAPYAALSSVGQASTMVPRNLEGASREALARLARKRGDIDEWVASELVMTRTQLAARFSPEQVDALGLALDSASRNRAFLNADQMGIGKGRFLAAMMRHWIMNPPEGVENPKVLFLTEKPINISDIWRDIMHIGAEDDFAAMIVNGNVSIIDEATEEVRMQSPNQLLMKTLAHLNHWPDGRPVTCHVLGDEAAARYGRREVFLFTGDALPEGVADADIVRTLNWEPSSNLMLATYTQFNKIGSAPERRGRGPQPEIHPKSAWVRNAIDGDTMIVVDECHNVSSGTSNMSANIDAAITRCGRVVFASATFAKAAKNMEIYRPLFPPGFETDNLTEAMRRGGETLQETLSAMLVKDGVMVRREHDLSKCEFSVVSDTGNADRNRGLMDALAPILAEMAYLSGDLDRRVNQINLAREAELRRRGADDRAVRDRMKSLQVNRIGFGSPLYNLSRLFICSLLADRAADDAVEALQNNKKPVVLVENTIQAVLEELAGTQDQTEGGVVPDFKDLMRRALSQLTQVSRTVNGDRRVTDLAAEDPELDMLDIMATRMLATMPENLLDPNGNVADYRAEAVLHLNNVAAAMREEDRTVDIDVFTRAIDRLRNIITALPEDHAEGAGALRRIPENLPDNPGKAVRRIREMIDSLPALPASAIDYVRDRINQAGFSCDEITGRSWECRDGRIVRRQNTRRTEIKNGFNSGNIDALIINNAGTTGIDLHASRRFRDQRKRVMIVLQPPADITRQIQAYGRVNRFDQVQGPEIHLLMAGLPIELRLLAMLNSKLRRLSANVTSNRDNASLVRGIPDLINAVGDAVCSRYAEVRPDLMRRLGFDVERNAKLEAANIQQAQHGRAEDQQDNQRSANEFLARLAMLPVGMQEQVMDELEAEYRATIEELDAKGENPLKTKEINGQVFPHPRGRVVFDGADVDTYASEFDRPVFAEHIIIRHAVEPIRSDRLTQAYERGLVDMAASGTDAIADRLDRQKMSLLEAYLPRGFASVDDALAQDQPTLTEMKTRIERLIGTLRELRPGCEVNLTVEGSTERGIVVAVVAPRRGYDHIASHYDIDIVVPGDFLPRRLSLGSLLRDEAFAVSEGLNGEDYDAILKKFDEAAELFRAEPRVLLVGNEWWAMNLAIENKLGSMTTYVDSEGVRRRGILVARKHHGLDFMPVSLRSHLHAAAALIENAGRAADNRDKVELHGASDLKGDGVVVKPTRDGRFVITLPNPRSRKWGGMFNHPPIKAMVERLRVQRGNVAAEGEKATKREQLQVNADALPVVLGHLMDAGVRFYMSSRNRVWSTEWLANNYVNDDAIPEADGEAPAAPRAAA